MAKGSKSTAKSTTQQNREHQPPARLAPGERVGDFAIQRELGSGGCGTVYLAQQISLGRQVALKVSENSGQEARMLAQLEHRHIVQVHSETIDLQRDARLICMQFVPGITLEDFLQSLRGLRYAKIGGEALLALVENKAQTEILLSPQSLKAREVVQGLDAVELAAWFGWKLADALAYAHAKGVLHLDVKPANVLINPYGQPLLTDFSVSLTQSTRFRGEVDHQAVVASFGGTYEYMPPEQLACFEAADIGKAVEALDGRADVFALGKVIQQLWRLLAGQEQEVERRAGARALLTVIERSINTKVSERYASCAEQSQAFASALEFYRLQRRLPSTRGGLAYASRHPALALIVFALVPQVLGSVVHNSYNALQIVRHLSEVQSAAYQQLILYYNLAAYIICAGLIWFPAVIGLHRQLKRIDKLAGEEGMAKLRARVLRLPAWVVSITSLGWLPNALLYPLYLHLAVEPISKTLFAHFVLSCVFSWLVALAYSFLYVEFIALRVLYPQLWLGCTKIGETAKLELKGYAARMRLFSLLTSLVPLAGATFIVFAGPEAFESGQYGTFRLLVAFLIAIGMAGVVFGGNAIAEMSATLRTLNESASDKDSE